MADYPLPKFHFQVEWGGTKIGFSEVSGLDVETDLIEYRDGASKEYTNLKMPGMQKYSNITLKRGVFQSDNEFFEWWNEAKLFEGNSAQFRRDIIISLLNESHEPVVTWKAKNAWALKIQSTDLNAGNSETALESLELVHEGLVIEND